LIGEDGTIFSSITNRASNNGTRREKPFDFKFSEKEFSIGLYTINVLFIISHSLVLEYDTV